MADLGEEMVACAADGRGKDMVQSTKLPMTPVQALPRLRRTASPDEASSPGFVHEEMEASRGYNSHTEVTVTPNLLVGRHRHEEIIQTLENELACRQLEYERRLALEREQSVALVNQATDIACSLRDSLTELSAEAVQLRARVQQLESELSKREGFSGNSESMSHWGNHDGSSGHPGNDESSSHWGNEKLIAALQVELADLERKLQRAQRARIAALEANVATEQRAEILAAQVVHLVTLLDEERLERAALAQTLEDLYISDSLKC
jgi:hypothetical protein